MRIKRICHRPLYCQAGFTLIEVMVAAVILFSVIASVSMIYRGAFLSSEKADNHINVSAVLPSVLATIRQDIRLQSSRLQGNSSATMLNNQASAWDINYRWQAELIEKKSAPKKLDPDTGVMVKPPAKYKLWQVALILERNGLTKQYQFNELSWTNE